MSADRSPNLLAWQWSSYPDFHGDRRNLALHAASNPFFLLGTLSVLTVPLTSWHCAVGGLALWGAAMAVQGRGHKLEKNAPIPFAGLPDVLGRIFLEQHVNFPRFVLSGGFARAWRAAG